MGSRSTVAYSTEAHQKCIPLPQTTTQWSDSIAFKFVEILICRKFEFVVISICEIPIYEDSNLNFFAKSLPACAGNRFPCLPTTSSICIYSGESGFLDDCFKFQKFAKSSQLNSFTQVGQSFTERSLTKLWVNFTKAPSALKFRVWIAWGLKWFTGLAAIA